MSQPTVIFDQKKFTLTHPDGRVQKLRRIRQPALEFGRILWWAANNGLSVEMADQPKKGKS